MPQPRRFRMRRLLLARAARFRRLKAHEDLRNLLPCQVSRLCGTGAICVSVECELRPLLQVRSFRCLKDRLGTVLVCRTVTAVRPAAATVAGRQKAPGLKPRPGAAPVFASWLNASAKQRHSGRRRRGLPSTRVFGDTQSAPVTVRRSAISAPGGWSGGAVARSPASRTQARGGGGSKGDAIPPRQSPLVRTRGKLAMTLNRCHGQFCAREVFSPRQPLPCGLAGGCAGMIEVARAVYCLWSAAETGFLFPGVTRSPPSVALAALSPVHRAA